MLCLVNELEEHALKNLYSSVINRLRCQEGTEHTGTNIDLGKAAGTITGE